MFIVVRFYRRPASCGLSLRSEKTACSLIIENASLPRVLATGVGGLLMREEGHVDCGSIAHTACELREDCLIFQKGSHSCVPATRAGGVLIREEGHVGCGSILHMAYKQHSFSLIETRLFA